LSDEYRGMHWSIIRKSEYRFFEKICFIKNSQSAMTIQPKIIPL